MPRCRLIVVSGLAASLVGCSSLPPYHPSGQRPDPWLASVAGNGGEAFGARAPAVPHSEVVSAPPAFRAGPAPEAATRCYCADGLYAFQLIFGGDLADDWGRVGVSAHASYDRVGLYEMVASDASLRLRRGRDVPVLTVRNVSRCEKVELEGMFSYWDDGRNLRP